MTHENIKINRDRIRIFLILYFCSEEYTNPSKPQFKRLFKSEVKLQKLDFWVRNPDYFSYSLLDIAEKESTKKQEIRGIVQKIFDNKEPEIRKNEMERFLYGAYEDINNAIGFLHSVDLIHFETKISVDIKPTEKKYYITDLGFNKIATNLPNLPFLKWYEERCLLIQKYFGDKTGTQLKDIQYEVEKYAETPYRQVIPNISHLVKDKFNKLYQEKL